MREKKQATLDVKKGWLQVSLSTIAAIGSATGNPVVAGVTMLPAAIASAETLQPLFQQQKEEPLKLPSPAWWTDNESAWQAVCSHIEGQLPAIIDGAAQKLKESKAVPTPELVEQAFKSELATHLPTWEVRAQDRSMLVGELVPPLLERSATTLREAIAPIREEAFATVLAQVANLLDQARKQSTSVASAPQALPASVTVTEIPPSSAVSVADELEKKRKEGKYDVYISYHDEDEDEVMKIGEALKARGVLPWFDSIDIAPGELRPQKQEEQIEKIRVATVFVGTHPIVDWQQLLMYTFIGQFVAHKHPVIPVLLPSAPKEPRTPKLPPFLGNFAWVDFRRSVPDPLDRLIWGITGKRPSGG